MIDSTLAVSARLWTLYRGAPIMQRALAALRPFICPMHPLMSAVPSGARVLDIGCGNGLVLGLLAATGGIALGVGIDRNAGALEVATGVGTRARLPLRYSCVVNIGDWPAQAFDVVTMIDVLHHVPRAYRPEFMQQAFKRVGENGRLVFKDMSSRPWWRVAWNAFHDLVLARQLVHVEELPNVIRWAANEGFVPVKTSSYVACALYGHELLIFERTDSSGGVGISSTEQLKLHPSVVSIALSGTSIPAAPALGAKRG